MDLFHRPIVFNHLLYKWNLLSHIWLFVTPWTVARRAPLSMGFPMQAYWGGLPFPLPGDLPDPGIEPKRWGFHPWVRMIPWSRKWQSTPVFLPGRFCGQRSLAGYTPWGCRVRYDWARMQRFSELSKNDIIDCQWPKHWPMSIHIQTLAYINTLSISIHIKWYQLILLVTEHFWYHFIVRSFCSIKSIRRELIVCVYVW